MLLHREKFGITDVVHHHVGESVLLLWRAVHFKREDHWQIGGDKRAVVDGFRHFIEGLYRAESVAAAAQGFERRPMDSAGVELDSQGLNLAAILGDHGVALVVPQIDLDVPTPLQFATAAPQGEAQPGVAGGECA
jgi:hypothetical protein